MGILSPMNLQIKQKFLILPTILYQCCIYPFQSALQLIFQGLWEKKVSDKEYSNLSQLDQVLQILVSYKHVPIPSTNSKKKKKKKKLETINKPPRLLIFVLFDLCLVSTPLFQCKAKSHTRTRFLKRTVFWTSHKVRLRLMPTYSFSSDLGQARPSMHLSSWSYTPWLISYYFKKEKKKMLQLSSYHTLPPIPRHQNVLEKKSSCEVHPQQL